MVPHQYITCCGFLFVTREVKKSLNYLDLSIIEGFHGKRAYIAFLADFHFLQDRANFWQTDLF